ncbi:alanine--tRNA ligase [Lentilitoribacter sp. Alg239-R112]|uniref:alanine--tRNA ligase n=1 Tax=Lentilitoribacter sp. Alg239-R112 TaxID=2305987 RepID=UPI0013A6DAD3|nr:alanine--tRNA ligase [Lentilitoribacter sp. Alg239-R112]
MSGVNDIRSVFLDYFKSHGHEVVSSSSLVPQNDPTLMFTNAGMVQFKNVFTGLEQRPYSTAATSQKCVRAGGKHNDLDNVGYTARHHTFFEMLGNFSFGDYFKEQAILHAWNLITKEYALPEEKLLVTVYSEDDEAADLWKKIAGLKDDRIIRIPTSDNFWSMGDTGPCGPCSEIFFDHGEDIWGGPPGSPEEDGDRFIEIWNLVFMQYEQISQDQRENLPKPSIDTGMGLERIAAVLQGKHNNYEIDLFKKLINASVEATGVKADGDQLPSHRVIADHLRACSFLVADGVLPSNEGRGYVLRRIMRRAMRHANLLGAKEPLMHKLVPSLVSEMGDAFPELRQTESLIRETFEIEEVRFQRTLGRGLQLLNEATADMHEGDELKGDVAFKLYDTYGFPLDLTQDALRSRSIDVDVDGFNTSMEKQKAEARANWSGSGDVASEAIWFSVFDRVGSTEFLGYEKLLAEGVIESIVKDGEEVKKAGNGDEVSLVFNQSPFYAEMGGQMGDTGQIFFENGAIADVKNVSKKADGLFVHHAVLKEGEVSVGEAGRLEVDPDRRANICRNHSATHLLHESLRQVLGDHVAQKGSLVSSDRLRFDFSHQKPVEADELSKIETITNEVVLQSEPVTTRVMGVDDAVEAGARALFGEKYGEEVRVVAMGSQPDSSGEDGQFSVELCGGTHVSNTGEIGLVAVVGESAVSAGVRRIEALSGDAARDYFRTQEATLKSAAAALKTSPSEVPNRVAQLLEERKQLEKELSDTKRQLAMGGGAKSDGAEMINDISFIGKVVEGIGGRELKALADEGKNSIGSGIVAFIGIDGGKAGAVVGVTDDLVGKYSAVDLVRAASEVLGGKGGGGRPDMAQAGGPDTSKGPDAIDAIKALL